MAIASNVGRLRSDFQSGNYQSVIDSLQGFNIGGYGRQVQATPTGYAFTDQQIKQRSKDKAYNKGLQDMLAKSQVGLYEQGRTQFYADKAGTGGAGTGMGSFSDYVGQTAIDRLGYQPAVNQAVSEVEGEFAGQQQRLGREQSRYGISPTSGRGRASRDRIAMDLALARAGTSLEARRGVEAENFKRMMAEREQALELRGQDITIRGQQASRIGDIAEYGGAEGQRLAGEMLGIYQPQYEYNSNLMRGYQRATATRSHRPVGEQSNFNPVSRLR